MIGAEQTCKRKPVAQLTVNGETHSLSEWSQITGLDAQTIRNRVNMGWPEKKLLLPPRGKLIEYGDVYTEEELYELYLGFVGEPDELQKLSDFADMTMREAKQLLKDFQARYAKEPHRMSRKEAEQRRLKTLYSQIWRTDNLAHVKAYLKQKYAEEKKRKDGA